MDLSDIRTMDIATMEKLLEDDDPEVRHLAEMKRFCVDTRLFHAEEWGGPIDPSDFLLNYDLSFLSTEEKERLARITKNIRTLKILMTDDDDDVRRSAKKNLLNF